MIKFYCHIIESLAFLRKVPFWWSTKITRILVALGLLFHFNSFPLWKAPTAQWQKSSIYKCLWYTLQLCTVIFTPVFSKHHVEYHQWWEAFVLKAEFLCWSSKCFQKWPEELICFCFPESFHYYLWRSLTLSSECDFLQFSSWLVPSSSYCGTY